MDFKNLKKKKIRDPKQKSSDFCQIFVISNKNSIGQDMDLKICRKSTG
jgi:hypothetical protein